MPRRYPPPRRLPPPKRVPPPRKRDRYSGACGRYRRQRDDFKKQYDNNIPVIERLKTEKKDLINYTDLCKTANNKLITKNNSLLDTAQYLNDQLFGAIESGKKSATGYVRALMDAIHEKDNILSQKIIYLNIGVIRVHCNFFIF